jgi:signal transduction protein with GAF and PtsI domain
MTGEDDRNLSANLRRLIETADIANALVMPLSRSIDNLLQVSAAEMDSEEASVLIRENDDGELRFLSVIGKVADQLRNTKIPAGKGIAGFVLSSGQPMAVSDAAGEESFYPEVDRRTGYSTQILLATPLRQRGEVIGVLEFVNRRGEPPYKPFTPEEMDKAALFAEAIAPLVSAYEAAKAFREMGEKGLTSENELEFVSMRNWLAGMRGSAEYREMLDLAVLVREIASKGEAERRLCRELLEAVLKYAEQRGETNFLNF